MLFGTGHSSTAHFDRTMASLLKQNNQKYAKLSGYKRSYKTDYAAALKAKDALGTSLATRMNMYNPMYYLSTYYKGYNTSKVAKHWRINTGIAQGDTASTTEMNLALALKNSEGEKCKLHDGLGSGTHHGRTDRRRDDEFYQVAQQ